MGWPTHPTLVYHLTLSGGGMASGKSGRGFYSIRINEQIEAGAGGMFDRITLVSLTEKGHSTRTNGADGGTCGSWFPSLHSTARSPNFNN